jgi:hypothetical protein
VKRLVKYEFESGESILVEVDAEELGASADDLVPAASPGEVIAKAEQSFDQALGAIRNVASSVATQVRNLTDPPHEASIEFGITLTGGVNAVLASAGSEATLTVTLTWKYS